ncbi:ATP-grasp domain-containing protein [Nonomuraea sp. NPDC004354]
MTDTVVFVESNTTGTGALFAERARALGLTPHVLCADPLRYPFLTESGIPHLVCDTESLPDVLAGIRSLGDRQRIVGVTSSSEYYIAAAARVAAALGLPGEDPEILTSARNKAYQRQCFAAHDVGTPGFHLVHSPEEAAAAAVNLGMPVVVKPISRSGSIGVQRCDTAQEVSRHTAELLSVLVDERGRRLPGAVLVESYVDGSEFSVELMAGEVCAVVAKHVDQTRGFLEIGHDLPACIDPDTEKTLTAEARKAVAALGLRWGASHVEMRIVDSRAYVIEVNPRLAGGMIPEALLAATGRDLIGEHICRTAGRPVGRHASRQGFAAIRFVVADEDGEVRTVSPVSEALDSPGVVAAAVSAFPGQVIVRQGSFLDRLGYVITTGDSAERAGELADQAVTMLKVEIVPPRAQEA